MQNCVWIGFFKEIFRSMACILAVSFKDQTV
jgi:hypothetical protein